MSREIKFRAWHKRTGEMYGVERLDFERGGALSCVTADQGLEWGNILAATEFELMQFTGLQDKDGKDGYEGDIIKLFDRSLFVIVWDEYYARFQLVLVDGYKELTKIHDMGMLQMSEIVGNLYENPGLIEGGEA